MSKITNESEALSNRVRFYKILSGMMVVCVFLLVSLVALRLYDQYQVNVEHHFDPYLQVSSLTLDRKMMDKPEGVFRILCLGGSTTLDSGKPQTKRWPLLLQELLQKKIPQQKVEVMNAGMHWYTTKHSLINYVTYYRDWHPDLVIIMHGINDLYRSFSPEDYAIGKYDDRWAHFYGPAIKGAKRPLFLEEFLGQRFLFAVDKFFRYLKRLKLTDLTTWKGLPLKTKNYPEEKYNSIKMFKRHLEILSHYAQLDGADVIFITEPYLYKRNMPPEELRAIWFGQTFCVTKMNDRNFPFYEYPSSESLANAMKLFNEVTKNTAKNAGAILIDADAAISKELANFRDDVHFTEEGARSLSQLIAETVFQKKQDGFLKSKESSK